MSVLNNAWTRNKASKQDSKYYLNYTIVPMNSKGSDHGISTKNKNFRKFGDIFLFLNSLETWTKKKTELSNMI